jgi:PleD family two-component response regulator
VGLDLKDNENERGHGDRDTQGSNSMSAVATLRPGVLVVDEAHDQHELLAAQLQPLSVEILHAYSGAQGLAMARERHPDVILLEHTMPELDGLSVLQALKEDAEMASIPVMLLTGSDDPHVLTTAFDLGATDCIRKPHCAAEVKARIGAVLRTRSLLVELEHQANYDNLTGLPNRMLLSARVAQAMDRHRRHPDAHFALVLLDCDGFKQVNDSLGRAAGDELLKELAARLRAELRNHDFVTRGAESPGAIGRMGGGRVRRAAHGARCRDRCSQRVLSAQRRALEGLHDRRSRGVPDRELRHRHERPWTRERRRAAARRRGRDARGEGGRQELPHDVR